MTKFKIQGVGLDTTNLSITIPGDETFNYIYTSIPANNDEIVGEYISTIKTTPALIVYTDFLSCLDTALEGHLEILRRTKAQLLLVDAAADMSRLENLRTLPVENLGIQCPESVEKLKDLEEKFKDQELKINYVAMPISPLEFNLELLDYCKEKGYVVIGLNPLGGYLSAPRNIQAFSVPYLLGFAATYSDIVLTSSRDLALATMDAGYLESLIGKESTAGYVLKKSAYKPVKEIKKAVYTSFNMADKEIVPYTDPTFLPNCEDFAFKIGADVEKITKKETVGDDKPISFEDEVTRFLRVLAYPEDGGHRAKFAIARYKLLEYLKATYPERAGWSVETIRVGESLLMVTVTKQPEYKGHFIWQTVVMTEPEQFYMIMPKENPVENVIFVEVKNAEEIE